MDTKQLIIVRKDLDMPKGKFAAQIAHASLMSYFETEKADMNLATTWKSHSYTKIILQVKNESQLNKYKKLCELENIPHFLVTDEGRTVFNEPTVTCLGIGPYDSEILSRLFKRLQVYRD